MNWLLKTNQSESRAVSQTPLVLPPPPPPAQTEEEEEEEEKGCRESTPYLPPFLHPSFYPSSLHIDSSSHHNSTLLLPAGWSTFRHTHTHVKSHSLTLSGIFSTHQDALGLLQARWVNIWELLWVCCCCAVCVISVLALWTPACAVVVSPLLCVCVCVFMRHTRANGNCVLHQTKTNPQNNADSLSEECVFLCRHACMCIPGEARSLTGNLSAVGRCECKLLR